MKTDPTDTGGLFVSRRPGTRPVKYRGVPQRAGARRGRIDNALAALVLALEVVIALSFWGPLPVAWLWVASQVQYVTDRVEAGLVAGFAGLMASLILGLMIMRRLDHLWVLMRRAAGHDQRTGRIGIVFGVTCAVGAACFAIWLILIQGPGSSIAPR